MDRVGVTLLYGRAAMVLQYFTALLRAVPCPPSVLQCTEPALHANRISTPQSSACTAACASVVHTQSAVPHLACCTWSLDVTSIAHHAPVLLPAQVWGRLVSDAARRGSLLKASEVPLLQKVADACRRARKRQVDLVNTGTDLLEGCCWEVRWCNHCAAG